MTRAPTRLASLRAREIDCALFRETISTTRCPLRRSATAKAVAKVPAPMIVVSMDRLLFEGVMRGERKLNRDRMLTYRFMPKGRAHAKSKLTHFPKPKHAKI